MMKKPTAPLQHISRRAFRLTLAISLGLTVLLAGIQTVIDYRMRLSSIHQVMDQIRDIQLNSLASALWSYDQPSLTTQVSGILHYPYLRYAAVRDQNQIIAAGGTPAASKPSLRSEFPLFHERDGKMRQIGTLELQADTTKVWHETLSRLLFMLAGQGVMVGIVALFLLMLFERLIIRHLSAAADYFQSVDIDSMERELRLERPPQNDELDILVTAFNGLREKLTAAYRRQLDVLASLRESEDRFRSICDSSFSGIYIIQDGVFKYANSAALAIIGAPSDAVLGQSPLKFLEHEDRKRVAANLRRRAAGATEAFHYELCLLAADGSLRYANSVTGPIEYDGRPAILGNIEDVTERRQNAARIEFLAHHDSLTGLPNRVLGKDRMRRAMIEADENRSKVALLFIDLDNFKWVNDSLGHPIGDELLKHVAQRLSSCINPNDTISRQGGDEFIISLAGIQDFETPAQTCEAIIDLLRQPFSLEGHELFISASIGISIYPLDGGDFDTLLKKADTAMYGAKESGRNTYRFFSDHMDVDAMQYLKLRNSLQYGLDRGEFTLHYQPQIALADGRPVGVEALIRWHHPEMGMLPPSLFIPVAEDNGLIVAMGEWVLREACRQAAAWRDEGLPDLVMAVNLSPVQFKRGNLETAVEQALAEFNLHPSQLELEITESVLIKDTDAVLKIVRRLRDIGVHLSIDDFGTGYSSLSYLKRFSVNKLKIDRSFIRQIPGDHNDTAIVRAIIQMARSLDLTTIAEGVETQEVLDCLRNHGCDQIQGYFFAKPLPAAECVGYLRRQFAEHSLTMS